MLTDKQMKKIFNLPYERRMKAVERLSEDEKKEYYLFSFRMMREHVQPKYQNNKHKRKAIITSAAALVAVILTIYAVILLISGIRLKTTVRDNTENIFKSHACKHGIQVDDIWFSSSDVLADYILKTRQHVVWESFSPVLKTEKYTYYYHENGE